MVHDVSVQKKKLIPVIVSVFGGSSQTSDTDSLVSVFYSERERRAVICLPCFSKQCAGCEVRTLNYNKPDVTWLES